MLLQLLIHCLLVTTFNYYHHFFAFCIKILSPTTYPLYLNIIIRLFVSLFSLNVITDPGSGAPSPEDIPGAAIVIFVELDIVFTA